MGDPVSTSRLIVGGGQYRNAVASGQRCVYTIHPTLPRYGTDLLQAGVVADKAKRGGTDPVQVGFRFQEVR